MTVETERSPAADIAQDRGGCCHAKVHVVDDDAAVRQAVGLLLQSAGLAVVTYASGSALLEAFEALDEGNIGCVLTDIRMPGIDGIALLQRLREAGLTRPVIVMTAHGDIATAVRAMKAGATEFIEKPFDDEALLEIIEAALATRQAEQTGAAMEHRIAAASEAIRRIGELSTREREVLDLLVAGKPNKLVAFELGISQRTAEAHRARMMARLKVHNLAEAVRIAVRAELAVPDAER